MEKRIKIAYQEQSNAVVANVTIEYSGKDTPSNDEVLKETQILYEKACAFSHLKTLNKHKR